MKQWIVTLEIPEYGIKKVRVIAANETEAGELACSMNGVSTGAVIKVKRAAYNRIK